MGSSSAGSSTAASGTSGPKDLPDPADTRVPIPVVASGGRSLNLGILARLGVTLLGRFEAADGERVTFGGSLAENVAFADAVAARLTAMADDFIAREGIEAPEAEPDLDAAPPEPVTTITELDLAAADVTSIIWATGFTGDLSWVQLPILDDGGAAAARPVRVAGARPVVRGLPVAHPSAIGHPARFPRRRRRGDRGRGPAPRLIRRHSPG